MDTRIAADGAIDRGHDRAASSSQEYFPEAYERSRDAVFRYLRRFAIDDDEAADLTARVQCISKTPRDDPHDRISHIGGTNPNGNRWKLTQTDAIAGIDSGKWSFYVERPTGDRVDVIVATRLGRKYLKTTADGDQPNNLLSLPECP